jgi:hypothetical protein
VKNTFSHDIAIAVGHYGLTADSFCDLEVDTGRSELAVFGGNRDFVSCSFSLRPHAACPFRLRFDGGRCRKSDLVANVVRCGEEEWRFELGADSTFKVDVEGLASYFVPQWGAYVRGKRMALDLAAALPAPRHPKSVLDLRGGVEVLHIANKLSQLVTAACLAAI